MSSPRSTITVEPPAPAPPDSRAHPASAGVVALLVVTALLVLTQLYAAIPLIAPVGAELGGDATFALSTAFSLCYAIGFLLWGPFADHYGHKKVIVIGLAALSSATLACALATSIPMLAVLRGVQGLAAASFAPVALAYLVGATAPRIRPLAIGAMSTAFLTAGIVGQVFASTVSLSIGWTWLFIICAIALATCLVGAALLMVEPPRHGAPGRLRDSFAAVARVAVRPQVRVLGAAHVTLLLGFVAMYTGLGPHLTTLGLDPAQVIWLRLVALPGMFACLFVGPLARRLTTPGVARLGFAVAAVGLVTEALLASTLIGVALATLVFVTGVALSIPAMITLFGETSAPHRAGGMALNGFVLFIGASLGPLTTRLHLDFPVLLLTLAGLAVFAAFCLTLFARIGSHGLA